MPDLNQMSLEELRAELAKNEGLLQEVRDERTFLAKQQNLHISTTEFQRLDKDIAKFEARIADIKKRIQALGG